jgi:hypothetical protein
LPQSPIGHGIVQQGNRESCAGTQPGKDGRVHPMIREKKIRELLLFLLTPFKVWNT